MHWFQKQHGRIAPLKLTIQPGGRYFYTVPAPEVASNPAGNYPVNMVFARAGLRNTYDSTHRARQWEVLDEEESHWFIFYTHKMTEVKSR